MNETTSTIKQTLLVLQVATKLAEEALNGPANELNIARAFVRAFSDSRFNKMSEEDMFKTVGLVFPSIKSRTELKKELSTWELRTKRIWSGEDKLEQLLKWL
jgi:hypothetical protein